MSFLSPVSLLWLAAIPVLVYLWRIVSTRRRIAVPSLVPFESLLRRSPTRRGRLVVNVLFWLQCAALVGLALALARPVVFKRPAKLTLAILDTSASLLAGNGFERARGALLAHVAAKRPTEEVFIVTTSPVRPLLPRPTSDTVALTRAINGVEPTHLGGNLSAAERIGRALLTARADEILIVTDEPAPEPAPPAGIRWITVGAPLPNVAFVGLDAQGPLCSPSDARVIATVQNFGRQPAPVTVTAQSGGRRIAQAEVELPARARRSVSLEIPEGVTGDIELALAAPHDGLELDNHAWLSLGRRAARPVVVRSSAPEFRLAISGWLEACQALRSTTDDAATDEAALVITDRAEALRALDAAGMVFARPPTPRLVLGHWLAVPDHPVAAYLEPISAVAAALNLADPGQISGLPVVSAVVNGQRLPVVIADERQRRIVWMRFDPGSGQAPVPVLVTFFNGLRWLMGGTDILTPGEPLIVGGFGPGPVKVHRPNGSTETLEATGARPGTSGRAGGAVRDDDILLSGRYRFTQGPREAVRFVNFLDPLESDLQERASTWAPIADRPASASRRPAAHPLSNLLILLMAFLLLAEWWRYSAKTTMLRAMGPGLGRPEGSNARPAPSPQPSAESAVR